MANLRLRDLHIKLGGNAIIAGLDLEVEDGEFLVLLGPSGCGKSTLLHSIAGLLDADAGTIEIGGRDMTTVDPSERGIGMVFQSYALYPTMTVEKNMSFGLRIKGTPKDEIARRIARTAQMLHLEPLLQRKPAQLSGGQRQRVAIGRALVREAGVFLFDEPLSNLDAKLRAELRRELKLLHQTLRSTMIYVTHDQVEAMTLASRIVVMRAGKIEQVGTPVDVYERPVSLFVAGFLGAPAMNMVAGTLNAGRMFSGGPLALALSAYRFERTPRDAHEVVLGIRPEHISVHAGGALRGKLALVELMGNHQIAWIEAGEGLLSAIVHDTQALQVGATVAYDIDSSRVSLFDRASERRL